jgi:hypothetical protein
MPSIVLTLPIVAGKVEAWRRFCQELSGSRLQMYITSRRRLGITHERLVLAETDFGSAAVTTLEASDVGRAIGQIVTSELPFDHWYRERLQELHGVNLAGYRQFSQPVPPAHKQELLFEWTLSASSGG